MARKDDWQDKASPQAVNDFHANDDVDMDGDSHHHTIGPGVHQAASGAHNHRDGNGTPILSGISLTGTKSGENSVILTSIVAALIALGVEDKST